MISSYDFAKRQGSHVLMNNGQMPECDATKKCLPTPSSIKSRTTKMIEG
jgi:hypothetical protein